MGATEIGTAGLGERPVAFPYRVPLAAFMLLSTAACHDTTPYGGGTPCSAEVPCRSPLVCQSGYCALASVDAGSTGGSSDGARASGGASSGGLPAGGTAPNTTGTGRSETGGTSTGGYGGTSTGGYNTGEVSTGGNDTGGTSTGGYNAGGVSTGGNDIGGTSTGGQNMGGTSLSDTGGMSTGGANTGGLSTGGLSTGGMSTGGANTGGASSSPPRLRDIGENCVKNDDCNSTHCVDLVCCDSTCDGQCEACNLQDKGGRCTPLGSGQPVAGKTPCNTADSICGGSCQGNKDCTYPDATVPCDSRIACINSTTRQEGTACDGKGSCATPIKRSCIAPDVCNINTDNNCGKASYVQVDVSEVHTCAVVSDGSLRCWGSNDYGQLGVDGSGMKPAPTRVSLLKPVRSVATGWRHTCVLYRDGQVDCWGTDFNGDVGCPNPLLLLNAQKCTPLIPGDGVVEIVAAGEHSCARLNSGKLKCWGLNAFGEIGNGTLPTPNTVDANAYTPVDVLGITDAREMGAGIWYSCAVLGNGALRCWGNNDSCCLGTGDKAKRASPTPVVGIDGGVGGSAIAVVGTGDHTCVLLSDGSVRCFGDNGDGQLGDGSTAASCVPVAVQPPMRATAVAVGGRSSCALTSDGSIQCWGANDYGELGNGSFEPSLVPVNVEVPVGIDFKTIVSKYYHSCALSTDGRLWCWGDNTYAQLGNDTVETGGIPVEALAP